MENKNKKTRDDELSKNSCMVKEPSKQQKRY